MKNRMSLIIRLLFSICVMRFPAARNQQLSGGDARCIIYDNACHECIQEPGCKWCTKVLSGSLKDHHCFSKTTNLTNICDKVESFSNSRPVVLRDDDFTVVGSKAEIDYNNIVQLKPQEVRIKLQKGAPANITASYKQVKDYPLDLYYLMDLSKSMKEDKITLANLGKTLANTMRKLTSQFKIGFGSFVDKVMLPFVNTHPKDLAEPCTDIKCATPFAFRNNLKLIEDDREFVKQVNAAQISSNLDSPEGGFDALMQAMVCEAEIGWRKNVRKIIIFSTDATFHTAGDGKLAGVVLPNDGNCHLNSDGYYDKFNIYDYPSIGQINSVAQEKGINIIFAVKGRKDLYQSLSHEIKDSAYGELDSASSNIVGLVEKVYNSITGKVEMTVKSNTHPDSVTVRFFTKCGGSEMKQTSVCSNIQEGSTVSFEVELMVADCPKDGSKAGRVEIGTLQESLVIEIEFLCTCACEEKLHPDYEISSQRCSSNGTWQCGVCSCNEGFYGEKCQCGRNKVVSNTQNSVNKCRRDSETQICSGKGRCTCETCICWNQERHFGKFCECDKVLCRQNINSKIECSGNGRCSCGKCECNPGWQGQFCECQSENYCIHPDGGEPCSGNGDCRCGRCECKVPHTGKYCEECPSCGEGKCFEFRDCVQCQVWESGVLAEEGCENCTSGRIPTLKSLDAHLKQYARLCTFEDDNGCQFNFTYKYKEEGYEIFAQDNQKCPPKIEILAVSFQVISGIVAIGVLTLIIWKIVTTIHDKREYERFVQERKNAKWTMAQNPGYIPPTTTVANPTFEAK